MTEISEAIRASSADLELHEMLRKETTELLGVSAVAAAALGKVGIKNVFDLGTSNLFAVARTAVEMPRLGTPNGRIGIATGDLLADNAQFSSLDEIPKLGIDKLRMLTPPLGQELATALDVKTIRDLAYWPPHLAARRMVGETVGGTIDLEDLQTEELRPRLGQFPTERVYYNTLVMLHMLGEPGQQQELKGPVSLKPAVQAASLTRPAVGALLTFSQSWFAQGVTLGHLLHSLALAPGEATRVAVIDWSRRTRATASDTVSESEQLDSTSQHSRALSEVQSAVASDFQAGGSRSSSSSTAESGAVAASVGTGFLTSLYASGDVSGNYQSASTNAQSESSGWSLGNRAVMGALTQNVNDRTEQHSSNVRNRRASAVREVSQSEHEQVSTRIVANYNHMHALTIQYFEVVQIYRVAAQLHRADRCLFVPMELLDFTEAGGGQAVVDRFRAALTRAALNRRILSLLLDDTTAVAVKPVVPIKFAAIRPDLWNIAGEMRDRAMIRSNLMISPALNLAMVAKPAEAPPAMTPLTGLRLWDDKAVALASRVLDRGLFRADSDDLHVPDDTELLSISFDGLTVKSVILDRVAADASDDAFTVPTDIGRVDIPRGIRLIELDAIHVSKSEDAPKTGTMTLHCTYLGRRFSLPALPVDLAQGTSRQRIATFQNDQADRRRELLQHLQNHREYYSQAIFRSLDSATLTLILSGIQWNGKPLNEQVEPTPARVTGNYLIFRAPVEGDENSGVPGVDGVLSWKVLLEQRGLMLGEQPDQRMVPIPTNGVFAEAVLGRSNSAEKLDITRFWNWQDSPIPLQPTEIAPISTGSRAQPEDLKPGQLGQPVLNIVNPTSLPDPAGIGAVLSAVANGNMFRDMSGLTGTQGLVQSGMAGTLQAATDAGQLASANMRTEAQKSVAMAQVAADIVKSLFGAGGGSTVQGISGDGARINHGRDMDHRGVSGSGSTTSSSTNPTNPGTGSTSIGGGSAASGGRGISGNVPSGSANLPIAGGGNRNFSREAAYTDRSALGFSPNATHNLISSMDNTPTPLQIETVSNITDVALWIDLIKFRAPATATNGLAARNIKVQYIEDGMGDLNVDMYGVRIRKMPTLEGMLFTPEKLVDHIRRNFNSFVDTVWSEFLPLDPAIDEPKWQSNDPIGAVVKIDIAGPDNAAVLTTELSTTYWRFSTVKTPLAQTGTHPVSGNREFGIRPFNNEHLFYTRGVDRSTQILETLFNELITFNGADSLWKSLQMKVAEFINDHQGEAEIISKYSNRYPWNTVVTLYNLTFPTEV